MVITLFQYKCFTIFVSQQSDIEKG